MSRMQSERFLMKQVFLKSRGLIITPELTALSPLSGNLISSSIFKRLNRISITLCDGSIVSSIVIVGVRLLYIEDLLHRRFKSRFFSNYYVVPGHKAYNTKKDEDLQSDN